MRFLVGFALGFTLGLVVVAAMAGESGRAVKLRWETRNGGRA